MLTENQQKVKAKVKIYFGRCLLDAIVHLYNYLEIFRKEYIKE